jgi:hypothetical protein
MDCPFIVIRNPSYCLFKYLPELVMESAVMEVVVPSREFMVPRIFSSPHKEMTNRQILDSA